MQPYASMSFNGFINRQSIHHVLLGDNIPATIPNLRMLGILSGSVISVVLFPEINMIEYLFRLYIFVLVIFNIEMLPFYCFNYADSVKSTYQSIELD